MVFSFGFKIWERNICGICGVLIVVVIEEVVVVVSERIGTIVVMVDLDIVWIGIVIETIGYFEIGVVMVPKGM